MVTWKCVTSVTSVPSESHVRTFEINVLNRSTNRIFAAWGIVGVVGLVGFVGSMFVAGCSSALSTDSAQPTVVQSSVRVATVRATGCGPVAKIGAGFAVEPGLVLTVAHTLRGAQAIVVDADPADLVFIDHRIDVAVLRIRDPDPDSTTASMASVASLAPFAAPRVGSATLLRRRSNVARAEEVSVRVTKVSPINIEEPIDKVTYHRDGFVAVLDQGTVSAGDSGSPIVDASGAIVGMVFATDTDTGRTAFAVTSAALLPALKAIADPPVPTGPCPD